eukprot:365774-Chlamydomonas_euryale.AAC.1
MRSRPDVAMGHACAWMEFKVKVVGSMRCTAAVLDLGAGAGGRGESACGRPGVLHAYVICWPIGCVDG